MSTPRAPIEEHPDVARMRVRYEQIAESPMSQVADGLAVLAGLYLAVSAWVVGFTDQFALAITNVFVGFSLALLAMGFASAFGRTHGIAWIAPLLGVWTIVAPWIVADAGSPATSAIVSNVITGAVMVLATLPQLWTGMRRPST